MSNVNYNNPPELESKFAPSLIWGVVIAFGLFLLLPISQLVESSQSTGNRELAETVTPPPPPPPPEMMLEEAKVEQEEVKEMKDPPPPPSLAMLEMSLSADLGGISSGDMAMPSFDVAESIGEMIFAISELDEPPSFKVTREPIHPAELKRNGIEGKVIVECIIDERGNVVAPTVHKTTNQGFNDAALKAVRKWKLNPGRVDGQPVKFKVRIPFLFNLN